jgi:hypothetical protein
LQTILAEAAIVDTPNAATLIAATAANFAMLFMEISWFGTYR